MWPMHHESDEPLAGDRRRSAPSEAVRERVLGVCRRELGVRVMRERRQRIQRWSLAAGVAVMLAVNNVEQQRMAARIDALVQGPRAGATAARPAPSVIAAWRARSVLLATLLLD